jgi:hypothetical protein
MKTKGNSITGENGVEADDSGHPEKFIILWFF